MGSSESTLGYRIIHVVPSSPASKAGLVSYLDFIVAANGVPLTSDDTLSIIISKSLNCKVLIKVFNVITEQFRNVQVTPSNSWGGEGLLGASIRWEDWKNSQGLRILEVMPESNGHKLGFQPKKDYILGTENVATNDVTSLQKILTSSKKVELFVFNSITEKVRTIVLENCAELGCTIGEGMMNSIKNIDFEQEQKAEEEKVVVTLLQTPQELPPPPLAVIKERPKPVGTVNILPPPSIYDLSMESLTFQPKVLLSKYIQVT
jgi:GRASP55/65 PDZ-like domain